MAEEKKPTGQEKKEASSKAAGTAKKSTTKAASTKKTTKTATAKAPAKTVQRVRKTTQKAEQITETIHKEEKRMTRIEVVTVMVLFCLATYFMSDIRAGRIEKRKNEKRLFIFSVVLFIADFAMIWKHYNGWPIIVVFAVVALISIIVEGQMKFWKTKMNMRKRNSKQKFWTSRRKKEKEEYRKTGIKDSY